MHGEYHVTTRPQVLGMSQILGMVEDGEEEDDLLSGPAQQREITARRPGIILHTTEAVIDMARMAAAVVVARNHPHDVRMITIETGITVIEAIAVIPTSLVIIIIFIITTIVMEDHHPKPPTSGQATTTTTTTTRATIPIPIDLLIIVIAVVTLETRRSISGRDEKKMQNGKSQKQVMEVKKESYSDICITCHDHLLESKKCIYSLYYMELIITHYCKSTMTISTRAAKLDIYFTGR